MSITLITVCNFAGNMLPTYGNSVKWVGCNYVLLLVRVHKIIHSCIHTVSGCSMCFKLVSK